MPPVYKLLKEMYGLPEAARAFNDHLHCTLFIMGFTRLQSDPQLYIRKLQDDDFVIISTHVDDLFIISRDNKHIHATLESLSQTYQLSTKDDPRLSHYSCGLMTLDQTAFIDTFTNEHG